MIGYVTIGTKDLTKAKAFYTELLAPIGAKILMEMDRIAFFGTGMGQPMLAVCTPFNEAGPAPGNGNMLSFPVASREDVDKLYAKAIALGATDEGAPGERMPTFYGGYFRDLDGNKIVFCKMG
ncbi:MAG: VOC family protein [Pseudomonadales bacterium]|nr:VOC family protein [Pseudomonadales bacterium]